MFEFKTKMNGVQKRPGQRCEQLQFIIKTMNKAHTLKEILKGLGSREMTNSKQ